MPSIAASVCGSLGGVARTSSLVRSGVTKAEVAAAVEAGALVRLRQGVYGVPATPSAVREARDAGARGTETPRCRAATS